MLSRVGFDIRGQALETMLADLDAASAGVGNLGLVGNDHDL